MKIYLVTSFRIKLLLVILPFNLVFLSGSCNLKGLIRKNYMPKVTELSLIAVSRSDICNTADFLPRVLHKLVLPINPKVHIPKAIETLTGLSKEKLTELVCFNHTVYDLLTNFINLQKAPTCFVAYNGISFDYPIILSEFKTINKNFSDDVLSIDMLHLMKDFFSNKQGSLEEDVNQTSTSISCSIDVSILLNDGYDEILSNALDTVMNTHLDDGSESSSLTCKTQTTTPGCDSVFNTPETNSYKNIQQINEKTPENQIIKLQRSGKNFQMKNQKTARRQLNFTSVQPSNFKLSSICKHIFGADAENIHSAEGDCLTMIRCAIQLKQFFVEWADAKAVPLNNYGQQ